ncbi:MAG: prolyl oligopeptidase family serine peptidase [Flavobacteriales bacterium]|nr:prolyl oligopeptidase family serine peptidase [Flavobacteriales bacterium]
MRGSPTHRGFVHAIAHIRGGEKKMTRRGTRWAGWNSRSNTFRDFIARRTLIAKKYADPDRLLFARAAAPEDLC